jgi:hypothetical protein
MTTKRYKLVAFYLNEEQVNFLKNLAKQKDASVSKVLRDIIQDLIHGQYKKA